MDVELIKRTASGRWAELFISLGIPAEILEGDKTEHPCPKCGGNTRFRLVDRDDGALFCSHCFSQKNGDGLAAIQWWAGCDFQQAIKTAAEFFGVKDKSKKKKTPEDYLEFQDGGALWSLWLTANEPISLDAVQSAGGRIARYRGRDSVVTFPYHGESKTTGYELRPLMPGGSIHHWDGQKKRYEKKVKWSCKGSDKNLIGPVDRIAEAEVVLRVEGLTDMLVANSLLPPGWVAVAVAGSANPKPWQAALFAGKVVIVVGDTDDSGRDSAAKWAQAIAAHATSVKVPQLPYAHTESGGKDLRDYLLEHGANAFVGLVESTREFEPELDESGGVKEVEPPTDEERLTRCLQCLGLDVLGETKDGAIHAYAASTRKVIVIPDIGKLSKSKLTQAVKDRSRQYVSAEPDAHQFRFSEVQEAIAWFAADRKIDPDEFLGRGLWLVEGRVVACNGNHLSIWNGDSLEYSEVPHFSGKVFELTGAAKNWFDHDHLAGLCQEVRQSTKCAAVLDRLAELLSRWTWENETWAPKLVAGLVVATYLQTAWRIRPQIVFRGVSSCGKSDCMKFLFGESDGSGVFGDLSYFATDTSSAGVTQNVRNQSLAMVIDEWDEQPKKLRQELLAMMRAMSSGGQRFRGSSHGKGRIERMRNMMWLSGIKSGMWQAADLNRTVQLGMLKRPGTAKWDEFAQPSTSEAREIGDCLLAAALVHGASAVSVAIEVESAAIKAGKDKVGSPRLLRMMSVPSACWSVLKGYGAEEAANACRRFAELVVMDDDFDDSETHVDLLRSILAASIDLGHGIRLPLSQILASHSDRGSYGRNLEAAGVRLIGRGDSLRLAVASVEKLSIDMTDSDARKTLRQFSESTSGKTRINGIPCRCVFLSWSLLDIGEDTEDQEY